MASPIYRASIRRTARGASHFVRHSDPTIPTVSQVWPLLESPWALFGSYSIRFIFSVSLLSSFVGHPYTQYLPVGSLCLLASPQFARSLATRKPSGCFCGMISRLPSLPATRHVEAHSMGSRVGFRLLVDCRHQFLIVRLLLGNIFLGVLQVLF